MDNFKENKSFIIYKILCLVNNKIYIGQTINLKQRKVYHFTYLKRNAHTNIHLQNAFNKYGKKNFVFEILEFCKDLNHLNEREQYWIYFYKSYNSKYGFNIQLGGHSNRPSERGLEKLKLKASKRNKKIQQFDLDGNFIREWPSLKSASNYIGCTSSQILRTCKGELDQTHNFQFKYLDDNERKIGKVLSLKDKSSLFIKQYNVRNKSKPIIQKSLDGKFITEYISIIDAVRKNNFRNSSQITNCLTKRPYCYSAYGYLWEYKK